MKLKLALITVIMLTTLAATIIPTMAKPTEITVNHNQSQDQWRGISAFGAWTPGFSYLEFSTSTDFVLTGKVLHTSWSYSPVVTDLSGQSTVYTYDKKSELWIEHEGQVSYVYVPGYGDSPVVNHFRGYLDFGGNTPSTANFVKGVAYQWAYLFVPEGTELTGKYTAHAVWDEKVGAYLVGFSVYRWSPSPPAAALTFPDPFPEPVPARNYNPLDL